MGDPTASLFNPMGSRFNVSGTIGKTRILANTLTGAVIATDDVGAALAEELFHGLPGGGTQVEDASAKSFIRMLKENGFLVDSNYDELAALKTINNAAREGSRALGIGITTTLDCNLRCVYCYETREGITFDEVALDRVMAFLDRHLPGRELLTIIWWGGEPLLRVSNIRVLTGQLADRARANDAKYQASMVTNGYLLDARRAEQLQECSVSSLQITLDGAQRDHDQRRVRTGGRATYDRILRNILEQAGRFERIILRINVDRRNAERVDYLLQDLLPVRDKVVITLRPVTSPFGEDQDTARWLMTMEEFVDKELEFCSEAVRLGYTVYCGLTEPGHSYCNVYQYRNSFVVDAGGYAQICPIYTGNRAQSLGRLTEDGNLQISEFSQQAEWIKSSRPFDDVNCVACPALPVCMGGCLVPGNSRYRCEVRRRTAELMYLEIAYRSSVSPLSLTRKLMARS